jgi:hypothetical protein
MRLYAPLLALALVHCGDDPAPQNEQNATRRDAAIRDAAPSRGEPDATTDARTSPPKDSSVVQREDAQVEDARAEIARDAAVDLSPADLVVTAIASPPTYLGSNGTDATCTKPYRTAGHAPSDGAKHPLFLYFVGTKFLPQDNGSDYDAQAPLAVTEAMARRGFVALSAEYDNGFSLIDKTVCLYQASDSLLQKACRLPNVDCALGIATWGHSQGALIAHLAANYDERVRAVWTTGYGGSDVAQLDKSRLRVVNGEADSMNAQLASLNKASGMSCTSGDTCLRSDGSGWLIVRKSACAVTAADHCWFDKKSCADNDETLEPNWVDADSTAPFALELNADWIARTLARP